jgi:hypothetical protein
MVVDMHGFAIPGSLVFGTQISNPSSFNTFENLKFTWVCRQRPNFWSLDEGKSIELNGKRLELTSDPYLHNCYDHTFFSIM